MDSQLRNGFSFESVTATQCTLKLRSRVDVCHSGDAALVIWITLLVFLYSIRGSPLREDSDLAYHRVLSRFRRLTLGALFHYCTSGVLTVCQVCRQSSGGSEDGKSHCGSSALTPLLTADHFHENLSQPLKGKDVDERLDHAVEEGEEEGPVQPLGSVRDGDGGAEEGEAVRPDADKEQTSDEDHLHCNSLQCPAIWRKKN